MRRNLLKQLGAGMVAWLLAAHVLAQTYPARPVKVIVPYPAGTGIDAVARIMSEALAKSLGQAVVVDNRSGAASVIGSAAVANAPADGHTLLVTSSALTAAPAFLQNVPFDPARDFTGVATLAENPLVLVVGKASGIQTVADLIAVAKARPGALSFASAGVGGGSHIGAEMFRIAAGFEALHVPYKGTNEAMSDLLAGRIHYTVTTVASALPLVQDGRLVALAMSSRRSPALPNVPTVVEAGVPGGGYSSWIGLLAPAKTPPEIASRLHQEVVKAMADPDVRERLAKIGAEPAVAPPGEFDAILRREVAQNARLAKTLGMAK